jgi:hypothetical protein
MSDKTPIRLVKEESMRVGDELVLAAVMAVTKTAKPITQLTDLECKGILAWLEKHEPPAAPPVPEPTVEKAPKLVLAAPAVEGEPEEEGWAYCPDCVKPVYEESNDDGQYLVNPDGEPHVCEKKAEPAPAPAKRKTVAEKLETQEEKFPCYYCAEPMPMAVAKMFQRRHNFPCCRKCSDKIADGKMQAMKPPVPL